MNPEIKFKRYPPDYSGLHVQEMPFCEAEDYQGKVQTYCLDMISANEPPKDLQRVVIFVHGGGFLEPCDKRQSYISYFAQKFVKAGYVVFSPDYPVFQSEAERDAFGSTADFCQKPAEVLHKAVTFIREHAASFGVDSEKIALMGGSAGAMLGFYTLVTYPNDCKVFANLWGAPNPVPSLEHFPPVISMHGTADAIVPYQNEHAVQKQLSQWDIPHQLIPLEGAGHTPIPQAMEHFPKLLAFFETYF